MGHKELIVNIKERFQLALLMSIFFPTFLVTYFTAIKSSTDQISTIALNWSILIVIYLISYIVFDGGMGLGMRDGVLRWLNRTILLGIGFFILPMVYLIIIAKTPIVGPSWVIWANISSFFASVYGLQIAPIVVLFFSVLAVSSKRSKNSQ